ncbi:MAG: 4Fe-4S binding protein [Chromatiales bacterium]|nr:4Fe-4S binding protein [Chromatiales bacterium]
MQTFEVGEFPNTRDGALPEELPALRGPALRAGVPDRRVSYKRAEDGIVLVDYDKCIGCKYCAWACPYGARELDENQQGDEEVHAVRRPHLRHERCPRPSASRPACWPARPSARLFGDVHDPRVRGLAGDPRARRLRADARVGHAAGQPLPAAAHDAHHASTPTNWCAPTTR